MKYIAIDIGSSFIKFTLMDLQTCRIVEKNKIPAPKKLENNNPNHFEISARQIYAGVKAKVDEYTGKYNDLQGVLLSTQMHGFIYEDSSIESNYISWQDSRSLNEMDENGKSYMEHLKEMFSYEEMRDCGVYIKPSLGMCNLYQLLDGKAKEEKNGELFTLGSYIIKNLTGNNICHITSAAPLGLVDINKGRWNEKIIKKAGFESLTFPSIAGSDFETCGSYISNGQKLQIYPDFGDQQTAILGCTSMDNDLVLNIATASQISLTTDNFKPGKYETRPYFERKFINTISNLPSGRNIDVVIDFIKDVIEKVAKINVSREIIWKWIKEEFQYNSNDLHVNMDFYSTAENLSGGDIMGINPNNLNLNTLFSAAFKNMAETYNEKIKVLLNGKNKINYLICSGGVSWRTPQLLRIISQETGYKHLLPNMPDEVFSGLFKIALVCEGICKNLDDTKKYTLKMEGDIYNC